MQKKGEKSFKLQMVNKFNMNLTIQMKIPLTTILTCMLSSPSFPFHLEEEERRKNLEIDNKSYENANIEALKELKSRVSFVQNQVSLRFHLLDVFSQCYSHFKAFKSQHQTIINKPA